MQQITQLIEVMLVGRGGDQAVGQATLGIDTNVGLHAKVPLIAFLGLMHLRIALLLFVLGRAGCLNDGGIDQGALSHHDACFGQPAIDGLEQLAGQLMLLQQVAEIRDGGAVRQGAIQDNRANRRMEAISYRASSIAPSLRLYQCCMQ